MEKSEFASLLRKAANYAYEVAPTYVTDELPGRWRFCLNINGPYEDLKPSEATYEELAMGDRVFTAPIVESNVIDRLWIDGAVPVWIDINVYRTDSQFTYFDLLACNRFSEDCSDYYYEDRGMGPFGVKSPVLPPRWDAEMEKFSLQDRVVRFGHLRTELEL